MNFNGGMSWSNLNILKFIGNIYSYPDNTSSQYIEHEFVGSPTDQIIRFKTYVCTTTVTNSAIQYFSYTLKTGSSGYWSEVYEKTINNVTSISISGILIGIYYASKFRRITMKIYVNGALAYSTISSKDPSIYDKTPYSYNATFSSGTTIFIVLECDAGYNCSYEITSSSVQQTVISNDVPLDASVNWMVVGNS